MDEEDTEQTIVRLSPSEKRALRMLAGALGLSMAGWTKETLREKWEEKFPDMEYPNEEGNIKPKKGK
jgi:hypothetical protein